MNQKLKNESDLIFINCTTSPFTRLKNWQRIRQERGPNLTLQFCLRKLCVSCFLRQVRTMFFFWGEVWGHRSKQKKNRVRTSFLMLTSACVIISLIACPIPQSHIKIRSGPQNVLCKHDLPNSVLNSLFHGKLLSVLKLCGLKHFPKGTALQTRLAKKHLIQEIGRCILKDFTEGK